MTVYLDWSYSTAAFSIVSSCRKYRVHIVFPYAASFKTKGKGKERERNRVLCHFIFFPSHGRNRVLVYLHIYILHKFNFFFEVTGGEI